MVSTTPARPMSPDNPFDDLVPVSTMPSLGGRAANALSRIPVRNALMAGYQTRGASNA